MLMQIVKNHLLLFASAFFYFTSKSELASLVLILCLGLYFLDIIIDLLEEKRKCQQVFVTLGVLLTIAATITGILYSRELAQSPQQLCFAMIPVMGYLVNFVLCLLPNEKEISEKVSKEG